MALCRGQAIDIFRWLSNRQLSFSAFEFARECELDRRSARRWLMDLWDRGLVRPVPETKADWVSRVRFEVRS